MCQKQSKKVKGGIRKYVYKEFFRYPDGTLATSYYRMEIPENTEVWHRTNEEFEDDIGLPDLHHVGKFSTFVNERDALEHWRYVEEGSKNYEVWKIEIRDKEVLEGTFSWFDCTWKTWLVSEFRLVEKVT